MSLEEHLTGWTAPSGDSGRKSKGGLSQVSHCDMGLWAPQAGGGGIGSKMYECET